MPLKAPEVEEVSLFQLLNPQLISSQVLSQILSHRFCLKTSTYSRDRLLEVFCSNLSPKVQRKRGKGVKRLLESKMAGTFKLHKTGVGDKSAGVHG